MFYPSIFPPFSPSFPPPVSLSMKSLPQQSVTLCVCETASVSVSVSEDVCVCVSLCVGVGDKAVLQHHCVYKAPVCCLLLLITAQHNVSAQLAMHKILCVCV